MFVLTSSKGGTPSHGLMSMGRGSLRKQFGPRDVDTVRWVPIAAQSEIVTTPLAVHIVIEHPQLSILKADPR